MPGDSLLMSRANSVQMTFHLPSEPRRSSIQSLLLSWRLSEKKHGCLMSDIDEQIALWAEYFQQLCMVDTSSGQPLATGLQVADAD